MLVKILLLVKDMPYNEAVVSFCGLVARATQATLTLLHAAPHEADRPEGERILAAAREALPDMDVVPRLLYGDPAKQIVAEIRGDGYDLVAFGTRPDVGLVGHPISSVTRATLRYTATSLLVVRYARPDLKRLLTCTGGIEISVKVIETSARLASAAQAQLTLLHVVNPVPSMYTGLAGLEETLPELLKTDTPTARHLRRGAEIVAEQGIEAELKLRHGVASNEILREATLGNYDLVVIGAPDLSTTGRMRNLFLGNVTQQIIEHAASPVLVIRQTVF